MEHREVDRDEFLAERPDRQHDDEVHAAWGAVCLWREGDREFQEHQPDIGKVRFFISH